MFVASPPPEGAGVGAGSATSKNGYDASRADAQDEVSRADERRFPRLSEETHHQRIQVCLSVCLFVLGNPSPVSTGLAVCLCVCLRKPITSEDRSVCLCVCLRKPIASEYRAVGLSVCLSEEAHHQRVQVCLSVGLSIYLNVCLSVCLSFCLYVYLSVWEM